MGIGERWFNLECILNLQLKELTKEFTVTAKRNLILAVCKTITT